jgi:hypothetical protein
MKQTAVEWLSEHLCNEMNFDYWKAVEKAKEMEKEQMALCYKVGVIDGNNGEVLNFEQYYKQTFNTKI